MVSPIEHIHLPKYSYEDYNKQYPDMYHQDMHKVLYLSNTVSYIDFAIDKKWIDAEQGQSIIRLLFSDSNEDKKLGFMLLDEIDKNTFTKP